MELRLPHINHCIIAARLTRDPELKYTPSGDAVVNIDLAINQGYKTASGEWKDKTSFIRATAWKKTAEVIGKYTRKGSPVIVEGSIESRSWETDGQKRTAVELRIDRIQFVEKQDKQDKPGEQVNTNPTAPDDDLPF